MLLPPVCSSQMIPMHTYVAPDEQQSPFLLYSSHPANTLATDGLQVLVSHRPSTIIEDSQVTLCAVLGFPGIPALLPSQEASQLAQVLVAQVQDSYDRAHRGGLYALEAALNTLHQYVQFINRDYQAPIKGFASCAEIRDNHLSIACSSGSLHVVLQRDSADIFPLADPGHTIGTIGTLSIKTYEAVLPTSGAFFMGADTWCTLGVASHQVQEARQALANAVAMTQSTHKAQAIEFFHKSNPEHLMLGLLMGWAAPVRDAPPSATTFVPPAEQHAAGAPPEQPPTVPDSAPDKGTQLAAGVTSLAEDTVMHSEVETEAPSSTALPSGWSGRISVQLMRWFSELFPDPQASPPLQPAVRPKATTRAPDNQRSPVVSTAPVPMPDKVAPTAAPDQSSPATRDVQPTDFLPPPTTHRPWVAMLLLVLIIVVPLASWLAFSVNAESAEANDSLSLSQVQQHVAKAETFLADGQHTQAQKELQAASDMILATQNAGGLSRQLQSLKMDVQLLWNDAFQLVPLVSLTDPLVQFPTEMTPSKVIVHIQDLYVLDMRLHAVYKYRLDELQRNEASQRPQLLVQAGDIIDGMEVGRIMDMSFQPTKTAYSDKPSLYLIDDHRNILQYNDTDLISVVDFGQRDTWEEPILIDFYSNRMYVADAGKGQIWRYNLNNTVVKQEGWLYEAINLSHAIRMHVDDQIWLLFDNNTVLLLGQGEDDTFPANVQKPFGVEAAISFDSRFVDLEVGPKQDNYLLLADPGLSSILMLNKTNGDYQHQLVAPTGSDELLATLIDVYVHRGQIYILTENALYEHGFSPSYRD